MTQGDFQSQVNVAQAPAVEGDFCDKNPRYSYDAGPGGLIAGPDGCIVARFAWATAPADGDGAPSYVSTFGSGAPSGFIHREQQGLIVDYLASSGLKVQSGFGVTLMTGGGFWAKNTGANQAVIGLKAYADLATGEVTFAATGSATAGGTSTASTLTPETLSVTGSIAGDILSVTAVGSGVVYPGATLAGSGTASGTKVVRQLTSTETDGHLGGKGTYAVSIPEQATSSGTVTGTYGLLTIGGTVVAGYPVGAAISGTSVVAGTVITADGNTYSGLTGVGGAGTYVVNDNTNIGSEVIDAVAVNVETSFYCWSSALPGELAKMTDRKPTRSAS